jgi:hypothetical protein
MLNDSFPADAVPNQSWSPNEVIESNTDWLDRILGWWYRFTTPSRPPTRAKYIERAKYQKARLVSTIGFLYLLLLALSAPPTFSQPVPTIISYLVSIMVCIISLMVNRLGKTTLAGSLLVAMFEIGLTASILSFLPLDTSNLPLYDNLIIGELLAASLLPVFSVFIIAFLNSAFIIADILYQPHTQALGTFLDKHGATAIAVPFGMQIVVAGVLALWVYNSSYANERANRAEMLAMLEHSVSTQLETENKEKQELEKSIQLLIQEHVNATNGRFTARISYPPAKVLWPLVGVINSLWTRLQHSEQNERELTRLRQAISTSTEQLHHASSLPQKPLQLSQTGTDIDLLIIAVKNLQSALIRSNRPSSSG